MKGSPSINACFPLRLVVQYPVPLCVSGWKDGFLSPFSSLFSLTLVSRTGSPVRKIMSRSRRSMDFSVPSSHSDDWESCPSHALTHTPRASQSPHVCVPRALCCPYSPHLFHHLTLISHSLIDDSLPPTHLSCHSGIDVFAPLSFPPFDPFLLMLSNLFFFACRRPLFSAPEFESDPRFSLMSLTVRDRVCVCGTVHSLALTMDCNNRIDSRSSSSCSCGLQITRRYLLFELPKVQTVASKTHSVIAWTHRFY